MKYNKNIQSKIELPIHIRNDAKSAAIAENNYGYEYVNAIFKFLGIEKTYFLSAENLDIVGNDADKIMSDAEKEAEILSEKF